jgi:tetratricopeptide (TPR) repeat protein
LKLSQTNYDVVISEPSNPWIAGIGNLYTTEFFKMCKGRLRPQGLMVQWFHLYEIDDATFKLVVRTFRSVFPHVLVWQSWSTDLMLVGSLEPVALDVDKLSKSFSILAVKNDLERITIPDPATLISLEMITERPIREYASDGPLNTEDKPYLEHWAPKAFFTNRGATEILRYDERLVFGSSALLLDQLVKKRPLTDIERLNIGLLHAEQGRGNIPMGFSVLSGYLDSHPKDERALTGLAALTERMGRREEHVRFLARAVALSPNDPVLLEQYAWKKFSRDRSVATPFGPFDTSESEKLLKRCVVLTADTVDFYRVRLADLYFGIQQYQLAFENYRSALRLRERYAPDRRVPQDVLLLQLAKCYRRMGDPGKAADYAFQAITAKPTNEEARDEFYSIWLFGGTGQRDTTAKQ